MRASVARAMGRPTRRLAPKSFAERQRESGSTSLIGDPTELPMLRRNTCISTAYDVLLRAGGTRSVPGFVYAFGVGNAVKVGFSQDPNDRARTLEPFFPGRTVHVLDYRPGTREDEFDLKCTLADWWFPPWGHGTEWFDGSSDACLDALGAWMRGVL